jgi:hypothetical protein
MAFVRRKQEPEPGSTFHEEGIGSALDEQQGRYGKREPVIAGGEPSVQYPRQGEDSPWSHGQSVPPEAPYPTDINFIPPVGETFEVQASLGASAQGSPPLPQSSVVASEDTAVSLELPGSSSTSTDDEIPDDWTGERRADGVPIGNPLGLRRRA